MLPLFESGIPLLRERLQRLPDRDNITIAYPDEGAWKRFHYQFGDYPEARSAATLPERPPWFWQQWLCRHTLHPKPLNHVVIHNGRRTPKILQNLGIPKIEKLSGER